VLVIRQSAQDRARPEIGDARTLAQQRAQHFGIEEACAVQQRKDKVHLGLVEQHFELVLDPEVETEALQRLAHFDVVGGVIAILGAARTVPQRIFCNEHDGEALLGFLGDAERLGVGGHEWSPLAGRGAI
jgi:hypothetical protein